MNCKYMLIFFCSILTISYATAQIISFEETSFDFGDIDNINKVSREIRFTNTGSDTLMIEKVKASCGCTASKLDKKELAPQESSSVHVSFNPRGRSGKQRKAVTFLSNDVENQAKKISFTANVVPVWGVKPNRLEFKLKSEGKEYEVPEKIFFISNYTEKPIEIDKVEAQNPNVTVTNPEKSIIAPGDKVKVTATVNPGFIPEQYTTATIAVTAKIDGEIANERVRVAFRPASKNKAAQ